MSRPKRIRCIVCLHFHEDLPQCTRGAKTVYFGLGSTERALRTCDAHISTLKGELGIAAGVREAARLRKVRGRLDS